MKTPSRSMILALGGLLATAGAASGDVIAFGRNHSPIGAATLTANQNGTLRVDNLGSSGQDGVSVDLSNAPPDFIWEAEIGGTTNPLASPGAFMNLESIGMFNGVANTEGAVLNVANNGPNGIQMTASFLEGDPDRPLIVNYELNGVIVASDNVTGSHVTLGLDKAPDNMSIDPVDSFLTLDIKNNSAKTMTTIDGETVIADMIDVYGPYKGAWTQESGNWLAGGGISSFTIADETVSQIPEPAAMILLPALLLVARRQRNCNR